MTKTTRNTMAVLAMSFATVVTALDATAADMPNAKGARAEIQIALCAPAAQIAHALDLRLRGVPIAVWQFDDAALTLFGRGIRLRLRVGADGRSELTLKVADQDCARLDLNLV